MLRFTWTAEALISATKLIQSVTIIVVFKFMPKVVEGNCGAQLGFELIDKTATLTTNRLKRCLSYLAQCKFSLENASRRVRQRRELFTLKRSAAERSLERLFDKINRWKLLETKTDRGYSAASALKGKLYLFLCALNSANIALLTLHSCTFRLCLWEYFALMNEELQKLQNK